MVFVVLDLVAFLFWQDGAPQAAHAALRTSWDSLRDLLRLPPSAAVRFEQELRERYLAFILAPEWSLGDLLERSMFVLAKQLGTPVPPPGIALYPITDGWLGSVLAGDRCDSLPSETLLPRPWVEALASGDAFFAPAPRSAVWLPVIHEGRLLACIEVRHLSCLFRAYGQRVRSLLAALACALAHAPLTGADDDLP
jgi:hypothetical protein